MRRRQVQVKVGSGNFEKAAEMEWFSVTWLEKVDGKWRRKAGANKIEKDPLRVWNSPVSHHHLLTESNAKRKLGIRPAGRTKQGTVMAAESCNPVIPSKDLEKSLRLWVDAVRLAN